MFVKVTCSPIFRVVTWWQDQSNVSVYVHVLSIKRLALYFVDIFEWIYLIVHVTCDGFGA
jgi:hypothetical protein